jgi:hypothetical protein
MPAAVQPGVSVAPAHPRQQGVSACRTHHDHRAGAILPAAAATTARSAPVSAGAAGVIAAAWCLSCYHICQVGTLLKCSGRFFALGRVSVHCPWFTYFVFSIMCEMKHEALHCHQVMLLWYGRCSARQLLLAGHTGQPTPAEAVP